MSKVSDSPSRSNETVERRFRVSVKIEITPMNGGPEEFSDTWQNWYNCDKLNVLDITDELVATLQRLNDKAREKLEA